MRAKKNYLFMLIVLIAIFTVACSSSSSTDTKEDDTKDTNGNDAKEEVETVTLKFASYFAGTSPIYTAFTEPFMKRVTELTEGEVQFEYYPSEQLGKAGDMLQLTSDGVADISIFPAIYFPDQMPLTNMIAGLPNLSESSGQGTKAFNELLKENSDLLETEYLKNGIRPIMMHVAPSNELWTNGKEIRVPSDLNKQKVRTPGGVANELYEFMGATPVAIPFPEIYEALDKGVIDVLSLYSLGLQNGGIDEVVDYAIFPHIAAAIQGIMINEKVWSGLSENAQTAMHQAAEEIIISVGEVYGEATDNFNEEFVANGNTIAELTEEEKGEWKKVADEFTESWLEEHKSDGPPYEEVLNSYKELLVEYK